MSKFKVGDKVKLNTDRNYTYVKEGIEYEIIKIQYLQFFNEYLFALKGIYDEVCAFSEKDFKLVKTPKIMYCVTTYLQSIRTNAKNFTVGKQYEIIDERTDYYKVKDDEGTVLCVVPKYLFSEEKPIEKRCLNCAHIDASPKSYVCKTCCHVSPYSNFCLKQTPKTKQQEFKELTQPISDWLYKNGSPHDSVIITQANATHMTEEIGIPFKIKD